MASGTSEELVDLAKEELLSLLRDPYGFEAYQRLQREKHPALKALTRLPAKKGALAHKYQCPEQTKTKVTRGRKKQFNVACEFLLRYTRNHPEKTLAEHCRWFVEKYPASIQRKWPHIRAKKKLAQKLSSHLSNYARKYRK